MKYAFNWREGGNFQILKKIKSFYDIVNLYYNIFLFLLSYTGFKAIGSGIEAKNKK